jgi:hypothetical protein
MGLDRERIFSDVAIKQTPIAEVAVHPAAINRRLRQQAGDKRWQEGWKVKRR